MLVHREILNQIIESKRDVIEHNLLADIDVKDYELIFQFGQDCYRVCYAIEKFASAKRTFFENGNVNHSTFINCEKVKKVTKITENWEVIV